MKSKSMGGKIIFGTIVIVIIFVLLWSSNEKSGKEITEDDNTEIHKIVSEYYNYIEAGNYELALFNIDWTNNSLMDVDSMIRGLYDINKSIIEEFKVEEVYDEAYFSNQYDSVAINVNYILKYKNTIGGSTKDIVLMTLVDGTWKIKSIVGLDRYGFYRAPEYKHERLIDFLDERTVN